MIKDRLRTEGSNPPQSEPERQWLPAYATPGYLKAAGAADHRRSKQRRLIDYIDELVQISAERWLPDMIHEPPST